MIFGFAGPAGAGKDTAADILVAHGFEKTSFAAPMKRMLAAAGFMDPVHQDAKEAVIPWLGRSYRYLAQTLGTAWGRNLVHPDLWVMVAMRSLHPNHDHVFADVRFENEAAAIRKVGLVVHITGRRHQMAPGTLTHTSEIGVRRQYGDWVIDNIGGMDELKHQVEVMLAAHRKGA